MNQLTPEEYRQLLTLGGENTDLDSQIAMQLAQAEAMRGQSPQMRQAGRVSVAPHWMELFGQLAKERASQIQRGKAAEGTKSRTKNTQAQNDLILKGILGGRPPAPPQGAFGFGGSGYEEGR